MQSLSVIQRLGLVSTPNFLIFAISPAFLDSDAQVT